MEEQFGGDPIVLVVDDDQSVLELVRIGLNKNGYAVMPATSGAEAITLYREQSGKIRLVLLDVQMKGLDGPQTLEALRQIDPAVRCCFMTGNSGPYSVEDLLQRGEGVFLKPFKMVTIVKHLRVLLLRGALNLAPPRLPVLPDHSN